MKASQNNLADLDEFIDKHYGVVGTKKRASFEEGYEAFKLKVLLKENSKVAMPVSIEKPT